MKAFANLFIGIAVISVIARLGAEGSARRGGARGLQGDEVPEEVPQEFHQRARRAAVDEVPEEAPEEVPQELEQIGRYRRSSAKLSDDVPEEAPEALHGVRQRRSPQMPSPGGMPPMPQMPPMPMPQRFEEVPLPRSRRHLERMDSLIKLWHLIEAA